MADEKNVATNKEELKEKMDDVSKSLDKAAKDADAKFEELARRKWNVIVFYSQGMPNEYHNVAECLITEYWYILLFEDGSEVAIPASAVWRIHRNIMPDAPRIVQPQVGMVAKHPKK